MTFKSVVMIAATVAIGAASPAFAKHHHHKHHKSMSGNAQPGNDSGTADSPSKAGNPGSQGESNGTSTPAGPANK